ncbi:MAG: dihydroorotate dehydrogenase [Actinomycetota bacterium]
MANLGVKLVGIEMKNPVMVASGTFGSGEEYSQFFDLNKLGALVTKSMTLREEMGNPPPRICETPGGMLNSIGLQNPGVTHFLQVDLAFLSQYEVPVIASVAGTSVEEYVAVIERLTDAKGISALEVNISCPNIKKGGVYFGLDPEMATEVVRQAKSVSKYPLIVKLTPNVTSISEIAKAVEAAGADALSLVNTFFGMSIDVETFRPRLGSGTGGLSGPAIKPLAVRMVYEVARAVSLPVIGMGGIMTTEDAVEFFLAGATAVAVGTANFVNPRASLDIIEGLDRFLERRGFEHISEIVGKVKM